MSLRSHASHAHFRTTLFSWRMELNQSCQVLSSHVNQCFFCIPMYLLDDSYGGGGEGGGSREQRRRWKPHRSAPMSQPFSPLELSGSFTQADSWSHAYSNSLFALSRQQQQQQHQPLSKSVQEMWFITFWRRAVDRVAWRSPGLRAEGCLFLGSLDFACGTALLDAPHLHNRPLKLDGSLDCSRHGRYGYARLFVRLRVFGLADGPLFFVCVFVPCKVPRVYQVFRN